MPRRTSHRNIGISITIKTGLDGAPLEFPFVIGVLAGLSGMPETAGPPAA